jgi:hypothetical protein
VQRIVVGEQLADRHALGTHIIGAGRAQAPLEELLVALADKLWKGARHTELERWVIQGVAAKLGKDFWEVFLDLDTAFEEIAAGGDERLARSR